MSIPLGAMSIPAGVVLMIGKPETAPISQWIIIAGFGFAIAGLALTFREERERARARREIASLQVLTRIASALGVAMNKRCQEERELPNEEDDV